jgi:hypothetical protein
MHRSAQENKGNEKSGKTMHMALPAYSRRASGTRKSGVGLISMRQAEAPFRCSRRLTVDRDREQKQ